jgi:hypothetical protein
MPRKRITSPVEPLERRLERLESGFPDVSAWQQALDELRVEVRRVGELASSALERAQNALETSSRSGEYDARLNTLTLAVAEGIQHVERAENRIRATVQRARQEREALELGGHPGLEAEAAHLGLPDGARGAERPMHAVRDEVGEDETEVIPLPGIPGRVRRGFIKSMGG